MSVEKPQAGPQSDPALNWSHVGGWVSPIGEWLRQRGRSFAIYIPKRLYARSLLIVIVPMILLQSVVAFVFMERHWQLVTEQLSTATVQDIAAVISMIDDFPQDTDHSIVKRIAAADLGLKIDVLPPEPLPPPSRAPFFSILDTILSRQITARIQRPFWIDTVSADRTVEIRIRLDDNVLRVFANRKQAYASNAHIFIVWMVATSLVLLLIAVLFLRNQIKPILALADAAERFGKGRPSPRNFRPRGAEEIRRAGLAFIQMRERIERQLEQRTAMLSGVSHDLRTILTRFRLQLAISRDKATREALEQDVDDMEHMLEGYLSFARGDAEEDTGDFEMKAYLERTAAEAALRKRKFSFKVIGDDVVRVRPKSFERLLSNVIGNAMRYATSVHVRANHRPGWLIVTVDDNGPGIAADKREEVFKPFVRLDEARNQDAGGTGLGLAIARDVARSHGGDISLTDSEMGGLKAVIKVPV